MLASHNIKSSVYYYDGAYECICVVGCNNGAGFVQLWLSCLNFLLFTLLCRSALLFGRTGYG